MKGRIIYFCILFGWCLAGTFTHSEAQTITTTFTSATVCPGGSTTIAFTTTGSFSATNQFTAQLSDGNGAFPASPIAIGTAAANNRTISATIPSAVPVGAGYKVRVVSSAPQTSTITPGSGVLTISRPGAPAVAPPSQPYCQGEDAPALSATASPGGTLNWYGTNPTGPSNPNLAKPGTGSAGSLTYYVGQTVNGCESSSLASIVVSVKPKPAPPATSPVTYCTGQTTTPLTASPSAGGTLNWYGTSTTSVTPSSVGPTPTSNATFYVSQTVNGCESARASLVVTFSNPPPAPVAATPAPYCQGVTTNFLTATQSSGATLLWWGTNQQGGTATTTAPRPDNQGSATYYVSQIRDNCPSPRTPISVTIVTTPPRPAVAGPSPVCSGSPVGSLSATASAGNTLRWWDRSQQGGTATANPLPVSNTQSDTYYVSQVSKEGCDSPREAISVRIKKIPGAPDAVNPSPFCQNRQSRELTATVTEPGATLNWYTADNQPLPSAPVPPVSATGVITYTVGQTLEGCASTARKTVQVTINRIPDSPSVGKQADLCEGTTGQALSATGASGATLAWYGDNQTGGTASPSPSTVSTTGGNVGKLTNYYVAQIVGGCESERASIPVRVKDTPDAPSVPAAGFYDFCQNSAAPTLTATLVPNATANWFDPSGKALGQTTTPPNTVEATYNYTVSQTLEGCTGPVNAVRVRVKPLPGQPGVSSAAFCNNRNASPLTASGERLKWYTEAETLLGTNGPTPPTNTVGDHFYKVSQTNGDGCEGPKATLKVTIKPLPGQPSVTNVNFCQSQTDQPAQAVSTLTAAGQNLRWYNPDGKAFPNAPMPSIDQAGVQAYQVSQTVNECEGERATLLVNVRTVAAPVVAKPLVTYCINAKATPLEASVEPGASARWLDPYNRLMNDAPTPSTLNTNVDPAGDRFFVYQIGSNGCYSPRSAVRVIVNTTPTLSLAAPVPSVNLGLRVPLKLTFTGSAPYSYSITGGYTGTSLTNDTTIAVLPRGNTTYQVTAVTNGCGIGLPGNPATAVVTVRVPTIETGAVASSTLCAGTSLTVPFTTTGQFNPGNAFQFQLVSVADTARKYDIAGTVNASPATATLPLTVPSGQYFVRVRALNPEVGITGTNSPTRLTVRSRPSATLSGTQTIYEGTPANLTIALGGDGPWTLTYADSVRSYSALTTVSPYVTEVRPARTTTYRITTVTNSCGSGPLSGTATVMVLPLLGVEDNALDPLVAVYPVPTSRLVMVDLDLPLLRNPAVLSVTNTQGQHVLQRTTRSRQTELDLSTQPNGLYILRIQVGDRHTIRKVIKL